MSRVPRTLLSEFQARITADSIIECPVLIVGAGPTGLVLALWLTRLGIPVRIIDKTTEPGTTSRALAVQARTLEFYHQIGLADAVIAGGVPIANLNIWVQGKRAAKVPFQNMGEGLSPYPFALIFPQDAHERLLIEQLDNLGLRVERQTELLRFEQYERGIRATLRGADGLETTCDAAYLLGCDGASSTVRNQLGIGFPGGTYAGLFYVADVEATGPATNYELHVDLEDADFLLVFPLRGDGRIRLVGTIHDLPVGEHDKLTFDDVKGKALEHLKLNVGRVNWFSTYHVHHRVAQRFRVGRAFLLGDAAHIHSPVGGQGMNTGIGDAVNLAWKLAAVLKNSAPANLLDTFEVERITFARRLVATTDRAFTIITARSRFARFVRTRLVPLFMPLLFRFFRFRRFMFRTVSQIAIQYRHSPLSAGTAGSIQGGDRLSWVKTAPGHDNFDPLTSMNWQVHVYGEARPQLVKICRELQLSLHVFAWVPRMRKVGLQRNALYLVRPDGYVALADPKADPEQLQTYFIKHCVRQGIRS